MLAVVIVHNACSQISKILPSCADVGSFWAPFQTNLGNIMELESIKRFFDMKKPGRLQHMPSVLVRYSVSGRF